MRKMYIICFLLLGLAFAGVYYGSYVLTNERLATDDSSDVVSESEIPLADAAKTEESIITRKTLFVQEAYSLNDDSLSVEEGNPPIEVLGYDRRMMTEYIRKYMDNMGEEEKEKGLISCELTSFSRDRVVLRKTYYKEEKAAQFYLDVQMGRIVVYLTEDDSLYAYTEVKFSSLPEKLQKEILAGKYIGTIDELYYFLETYSS